MAKPKIEILVTSVASFIPFSGLFIGFYDAAFNIIDTASPENIRAEIDKKGKSWVPAALGGILIFFFEAGKVASLNKTAISEIDLAIYCIASAAIFLTHLLIKNHYQRK